MRKFLITRVIYTLFAFLFLVFIPLQLHAQMFSIGEEEPERNRNVGFYSSLGVSWEIADFEYTGSGAPLSERVDFSSSILRIRFETPGLNLGLGFGGSLTGMDETSYVNVTGRIFNDFPLIRRESFILTLPIQITTDLKSAQSNNTNAEFQQSSLVIGSGLGTAMKLSDDIEFTLRSTPNFGFSFSQGNLFGGNLFRFDGRAQLFFNELIGNHSLSIEYHFDYRDYEIEGDLNDYSFLSHSFTIGYAF